MEKRLRCLLPHLISNNQSAFIPNRIIGDNILLAQSLCRDYHKDQGPPRCAIKLDLHKAFDTVKWSFIFDVLKHMNFPERFINWTPGLSQMLHDLSQD